MDFIFIGNTWEAGRDNPICHHQMALELVRRGRKVLWIEGSGMRTPSLASRRDRWRIVRKVWLCLRGAKRVDVRGLRSAIPSGVLRVVSPLFLPLPHHGWVRRLNGWICRAYIHAYVRRMGLRTPVLLNAVPVFAEAMRWWGEGKTSDIRLQTADIRHQTNVGGGGGPRPGVGGGMALGGGALPPPPTRFKKVANGNQDVTDRCETKSVVCALKSAVSRCPSRIVYYCIDRWDAYPGYDSRLMAETDRRCCEWADVVLASSGVLADRCRRFNENVHLLPHGVDHPLFSRALQRQARPDDLPAGRIAGFFGSLSAWLDQDLLLELARRVPECEIVLIGRADVPVDRLRKARNIHLLGARPFRQLPGYLAHFDVGLIPYVVNDLTMAVNPTKLREMLAGGCPVVASGLPEVRPYVGRGATVCGTVEAFADAVAKLVREPLSPMERLAISRGVAQETWEAKVDEMLGWVGGGEEVGDRLPVIGNQ